MIASSSLLLTTLRFHFVIHSRLLYTIWFYLVGVWIVGTKLSLIVRRSLFLFSMRVSDFKHKWIDPRPISIVKSKLELGIPDTMSLLSIWLFEEGKGFTLLVEMADAVAIMEAAGSRFSDLELIGRGSFGDVYKG